MSTNFTSSWFSDITQSENDSLSLDKQFEDDRYNYKLNFAFSDYRGENGKTFISPVVRLVEKVLANDDSLTKNFLPPFGYDGFNRAGVALLLGEHSRARVENRTFGIQTMSGTGAIRLAAEFFVRNMGMTTVYSTQTALEELDTVFLNAGFKEHLNLRYVDSGNLTLDIDALLTDLKQAKEKSVVFLHACGHNPTGYDPSIAQWEQIAEVVAAQRLFPFFYSCYQGFASGDINRDVASVRTFERRGLEFFCAQSFSWNFGLYNERVGTLICAVKDTNTINPIKSQFLPLVNSMFGTPPSHGARIVAFILGDRILTEEWQDSLKTASERLKRMRFYLREELERLGAQGTWQHITNQVGLFCLTGLNEIQVEHLKKQHHIYLKRNGRLNVSGLTPDNVEYVARAIYETLSVIPPRYRKDSM